MLVLKLNCSRMRKEVILAVIAGITLGLVIAFGSWRLAKTIKNNAPKITKKETPVISRKFGITLDKINNLDVLTSDSLIRGLTLPNSSVVVLTQESDFYIKSDENGEFETEIKLPGGLSQINVIAFNDSGESSQLKVNLVYSSEFSKYLKDDSSENAASDEASVILNKVSELTKKPIAYVGTITDIAGKNIQIKSIKGDIEQIAINDNAAIINTLKKNVEVKEQDLALGDFIVAMGFSESNKVLDTRRILITSDLAENKNIAVFAKLRGISKTKLEVDTSLDGSRSIVLPKKWNGPDIKNLSESNTVILTGVDSDKGFNLRSIFNTKEN